LSGWKTSGIGVFHGKSGGVIDCQCGTVIHVIKPMFQWKISQLVTGVMGFYEEKRMFLTHGFHLDYGLLQHLVGLNTQKISRCFTRQHS